MVTKSAFCKVSITTSAVLGLLITQPVQAQVSTFNLNDPGFFDTTGQTSDTLESFDNSGFSLTLTSSFGFVGADPNGATANAHSANLSIISGGSFNGFLFGNNNSFSDLGSGGEINGFQRLDFEFDSPVELTDVQITDLDSSTTGFVDAVGIEGFTSSPGTLGTGIDPILSLGANVAQDTIGIEGSSEEIVFVADNLANGASGVNTDDLDHTASFTFGTPVTSFSLVLFNNLSNATGGEHGVGVGTETFQITVNEVPFEFSPSLGLFLSGAGFLGIKTIKKKQKKSKIS